MALGDIIEMRVVCQDPVSPVQIGINVIRYRVTAFGALEDVLYMAQALDAVIAPLYKPLLANSVQYRGVIAQKINPLPRGLAKGTNTNAGAGTGGASMAPTQVSPLIKFTTLNAGRAYRGRIYIPFPAQQMLTASGNLTAGALTNLQALATALKAAVNATDGLNTATLLPVIWHAKNFGTPPGGALTSTFVFDAIASPLLATQRRRGNYGQVNPTSPV